MEVVDFPLCLMMSMSEFCEEVEGAVTEVVAACSSWW